MSAGAISGFLKQWQMGIRDLQQRMILAVQLAW